MTTLDAVNAKKKPEPSAEEVAAKELVRAAREHGLSLTGPDGLLKQFTKNVLETALNEEMTEHLGHEKNRAEDGRESSNVRNGTRPKTVLTEATGHVQLDVPRDRDGSFEPRSPPGSRRATGRRVRTTTSFGGSRTRIVERKPMADSALAMRRSRLVTTARTVVETST
jgi:putative transposase